MSTAAAITPTVNPAPQPVVAICEHIRDNGLRCGSPALHGQHFCYHHSRAHFPAGRLGERNYRAPLPETIESLQLQLHQITEALGSGRIDDKVAGKLLYAVQLSTNLLKMKQKETSPSSASRSSDHPITSSSDAVTEVPPAMYESLSPRPLTEEEQINPQRTSDTDPDMPQTVAEAQRAILDAVQYTDLLDSLRRCDKLSPRHAKLTRRVHIHTRALEILRDAGKFSVDAWVDTLTILANQREKKQRKQ